MYKVFVEIPERTSIPLVAYRIRLSTCIDIVKFEKNYYMVEFIVVNCFVVGIVIFGNLSYFVEL